MHLSTNYILISSSNWQPPSTSQLLNLITLAVTGAIVLILLISLAAGGFALAMSAFYFLRYLLESAVTGWRQGKGMENSELERKASGSEIERKPSSAQLVRGRGSGGKAISVTDQLK